MSDIRYHPYFLGVFQEAFQVDNETLVLSLTNLALFIERLDLKYQAATVDLRQSGGGAHLLTQRRGRQVAHIDYCANGDIAGIKMSGDCLPRSILHQCNHHGSGEDLDSPGPDVRGGIFMYNSGGRFAGQPDFKRHRYNPLFRQLLRSKGGDKPAPSSWLNFTIRRPQLYYKIAHCAAFSCF